MRRRKGEDDLGILGGIARRFNSAAEDAKCKGQVPLSISFIGGADEWRSNESRWHPAFVDIVRSNSYYEMREAAGYVVGVT